MERSQLSTFTMWCLMNTMLAEHHGGDSDGEEFEGSRFSPFASAVLFFEGPVQSPLSSVLSAKSSWGLKRARQQEARKKVGLNIDVRTS